MQLFHKNQKNTVPSGEEIPVSARTLFTSQQLSEAEKTRMRAFLSEYADMSPLRSTPTRVQRPVLWMGKLTHPFAFAMIAFVFITGSGTAYAAELSLPGTPLYGLKTNVIESVRAGLAITPEAKARWATTQTARRVHEAETLARENKLTPELGTQLAEAIGSHIATAESYAQATRTPDANVHIEEGLRATVTGSAKALLAAQDTITADEGQKAQLERLVMHLDTYAVALLQRDDAETDDSDEPERADTHKRAFVAQQEEVAGRLIERNQDSLLKVALSLATQFATTATGTAATSTVTTAANNPTTGAATTSSSIYAEHFPSLPDISQRLEDAKRLYAEGKAAAAEGELDDARQLFQNTLETVTNLRANQRDDQDTDIRDDITNLLRSF